jgi:Na+-driven multidrug efflux pump
MSGNAAAGNIEGFVYTTMNSFHQTALNFVGQNYGARRFDRIRRIMVICLVSVFVAGAAFGSAVYLCGRPLLSVYITDSQEAIEAGLVRMAYICLPYFLCGLMDVTTGLIRGLGHSLVPMVVTVVGVCGLRLLWIYTVFRMPEFHTLPCLYMSYIISWSLTFIVELVIFIVLLRKVSKRSGNGG